MTKKQNDFDPNELIKASEDHEKTLAELQESVKKLDIRVGDSAALAKSFKSAFENDKKMDAVLTALICDLIQKDDDLRRAIRSAVKNVDRDWWNGAWKKGLGAAGAVFLIFLGWFIPKLFGE